MTQGAQFLRILPEVILTITGVAIMMIDPLLAAAEQPQSVWAGWQSLGAFLALAASLQQMQLAPGTAYYGLVQTDAFSIFFHVLITASSWFRCWSRWTASIRPARTRANSLRWWSSAQWACC